METNIATEENNRGSQQTNTRVVTQYTNATSAYMCRGIETGMLKQYLYINFFLKHTSFWGNKIVY